MTVFSKYFGRNLLCRASRRTILRMLKACTRVMSDEASLSIRARSSRRVTAMSSKLLSPATMDRSEYGKAADRRVVDRESSVIARISSYPSVSTGEVRKTGRANNILRTLTSSQMAGRSLRLLTFLTVSTSSANAAEIAENVPRCLISCSHCKYVRPAASTSSRAHISCLSPACVSG